MSLSIYLSIWSLNRAKCVPHWMGLEFLEEEKCGRAGRVLWRVSARPPRRALKFNFFHTHTHISNIANIFFLVVVFGDSVQRCVRPKIILENYYARWILWCFSPILYLYPDKMIMGSATLLRKFQLIDWIVPENMEKKKRVAFLISNFFSSIEYTRWALRFLICCFSLQYNIFDFPFDNLIEIFAHVSFGVFVIELLTTFALFVLK